MPRFRWNDWNAEHVARHGIGRAEAEAVIAQGHVRKIGNRKYKAIGRGHAGRWIQVIYIFDPPGIVYAIHARPLTSSETRQFRRRNR